MVSMINEEKEKEIVSLLEKTKNSKLFLEVTGYISRLDGYIYKLEKENKKLNQDIKQRDEVIEECIESIQNFMTHIDDGFCADMMTFIEILNKYKKRTV